MQRQGSASSVPSRCRRCRDGDCCDADPRTGDCYGRCDSVGSHVTIEPGRQWPALALGFDDLREANVTRCAIGAGERVALAAAGGERVL